VEGPPAVAVALHPVVLHPVDRATAAARAAATMADLQVRRVQYRRILLLRHQAIHLRRQAAVAEVPVEKVEIVAGVDAKFTWKLEMKKNLFVLAALSVGTAHALRAQFAEDALRFSTFNQGIGARSQAMGNVAVGLGDDYTSLFSNPAGLALQRSFEFSLGLTRNGYQNNASFLGNETTDNTNAFNLNNLGLVYPVPVTRGSLTLGLGFGRVANYASVATFDGFNAGSSIAPSLVSSADLWAMTSNERREFILNDFAYGLGLADTANGYFYPVVTDSVNQSGTIIEGGGINSWSVGGGMDVGRELSLGVSVNFLSGGYSYDREYVERDSKNIYHYAMPFDFDRFTYVSTINSQLSGFNMLFGLLYHKQGKLRIGAAVRTPTRFDVEESFTDEGRTRFDNGDSYNISTSGTTRYKVTTPFVFSGGMMFQLTDWLVLAGDAEYTDWTQMEFNNDNADLAGENRVIRNIYQETTNLRGGAEVTLWELGLKLRVGFLWNPSPYKADANNPDFNQLGLTGGIGFMIDEQTSLNIAAALGQWKTFRNNYYLAATPSSSTTSEKISSNSVNVTFSFKF
jgi:long-subunit fatty acid transport protein